MASPVYDIDLVALTLKEVAYFGPPTKRFSRRARRTRGWPLNSRNFFAPSALFARNEGNFGQPVRRLR